VSEPHDHNQTVDHSAGPADSLDPGLAAAFAAPRSSLDGSRRPVLLKEAEGECSAVVKAQSDAMPAPEHTGNRYQLQGEIARGGMGAVLRGRDVDLGRDLAFKVLLEKHAQRPEVARRFLEEAQVGAQLQHPGVVPVYDIGRFGERPFFTMKLVKGQTLAALLGERADPPQDRPRFLAIALQVAQALAYAHAKGVIHRDLKPANIMVGAFGEVQVMDWGLAKVLQEGGADDEGRTSRERQRPEDASLIRTARSTGSAGTFGTQTEAGSLLGTPAYMPPEQANGDVALLDRRADVFGLGAILCEILTGKPPYVGRSSEEVRRKAANGDLADSTARLDACGADTELIALTKACLSPEAIDRPRDAQEVADRLSAYQSGVQERLQTAERERAVAVAREAEQRKRRRVQLALAVAAVALLVGGGAFAWWRNEQAQAGRERDARNAEAVTALLGHAEEALRAGDAAKAAVALEAARKRSDEGGAEKETKRLGRFVADLAVLKNLDAVDQFRWTVVDNHLPDAAAVARRTREALRKFGADPEAAGEDQATALVATSAARDRIVAALDRVLRQDRTAGVRALLRRVDADPYRDAVRDVVLANDTAKMGELAGQPAALEQPAGFVAFLGESQAITIEQRRHLLATALHRRPGDLNLLMTLGDTYPLNQDDGAKERLRWFQAAVAAAPVMPAAHNNLGIALRDKRDLAGAEAAFRKAIELDPKCATAHHNLGVALADTGRLDEAIALFHQAIEVVPNFAMAHNSLGSALAKRGQIDLAIASFRKAIKLDSKFAAAHYNLGKALRDRGRLDEAVACWRKTIALDPKSADGHARLGAALADQRRFDEAVTTLRTAIKLEPKDAVSHGNLGFALAGKGHVDEAIACYQKAITLAPTHAKTLFHLGIALYGKGQMDRAIVCFRKATKLDPKYARAHSNLGAILCDFKRDFDGAIACFQKAIALEPKDAVAHFNLGNALRAKGRVNEAIASYQKAIARDPKYAAAHGILGLALAGKGQLDEAIACYQKAIALDSKNAGAHCNLGEALGIKGQLDKAITSFKKAIALDPKLASAHANLGTALANKGQVDEAIVCWCKAIALNPMDTRTQSNLGAGLLAKGEVDAAIACLRKAIALNPKDATARNSLGHALKDNGQLDEALASYKKAIELEPNYAEAHCNLGHALRQQGRFADALAAYKRGHELGTKRPSWRYPSAQWIVEAQWMAGMETKLTAFLNGEFQPKDAAQRLGLVGVCQAKQLHHAATRLWVDAFTVDPKLTDDPKSNHRYNAACSAALAAAGKGQDAGKLDYTERTRLRMQALNWLAADLAQWRKQLDTDKPADRAAVRRALNHWQKDGDLAGIRDKEALAKLATDEQKPFAQLWADVAALVKKAEEKPKGGKP
jgi:tetratricopeptide (TPR) repeat protein